MVCNESSWLLMQPSSLAAQSSHALVYDYADYGWQFPYCRPWMLLIEPGWMRLLIDEVPSFIVLLKSYTGTEPPMWSSLFV